MSLVNTAIFNGNTIILGNMVQPYEIGNFIKCMRTLRKMNVDNVTIDTKNLSSIYTSVATGLAALMQDYSSRGIKFTFTGSRVSYLNAIGFPNFICPNNVNPMNELTSLNKIWKFKTADDVNKIVNATVRDVGQGVICENGVIESISWCLSEMMDNVLQHSDTDSGYFLSQLHQSTSHFNFTIFDCGMGIYNSLKRTRHRPSSHLDAITKAVQRGVTRDSEIGQGNGLWGLHSILENNQGVLRVSSGQASYSLRTVNNKTEIKTSSSQEIYRTEKLTTMIDVSFNTSKGIALAKSLGGHDPVSLRLESFDDISGACIYVVANQSSGTGTRQSGEKLRNECINLLKEKSAAIHIDFSGIAIVASSFSDEFIGKLFKEFGPIGFFQNFKIKSTSSIVETIINKSIIERMRA